MGNKRHVVGRENRKATKTNFYSAFDDRRVLSIFFAMLLAMLLWQTGVLGMVLSFARERTISDR